MLGLPNCSWNLACTITDTIAGPNIGSLYAIDPSKKKAFNDVKLQRLRSTTETALQGVGSICSTTKIGHRVSDTTFLVVEKLAADVVSRMAFIDANVKSIFPRNQMIYRLISGTVAIKSANSKDSSIAQVNDMAKRPISCRVA